MYCAVSIKAGDHEIELRYWTPGLLAGGIISLAGIGFWIKCGRGVRKEKRRGR